MALILTSFKESKRILDILPESEIYSVSRYQPSKYHYETLEFLGAYDKDKQKLSLRELGIDGYKRKLYAYYVSRWDEIYQWMFYLHNDKHVILCCWCPYSTSTKNQVKEYGTFVCHTGLIGKMVEWFRKGDIDILMDNDRHMRLIPEYKPDKYKVI